MLILRCVQRRAAVTGRVLHRDAPECGAETRTTPAPTAAPPALAGGGRGEQDRGPLHQTRHSSATATGAATAGKQNHQPGTST